MLAIFSHQGVIGEARPTGRAAAGSTE